MPQFDLRAGASPLFALLAIGLAALFAYLYYRTTLPPVSALRRRVLLFLRGTALALLILLLLEPILRITTTTDHPPVLTLAVDESRSMGITDRTGDRAEAVRALLRSPALERIRERAELRVVAFGTTPRSVPPESLAAFTPAADGTDIGAALQFAARERTAASHALLLVTDGVTTVGRNPLHDAESFGIPVFTVGIGDPTEQRDVLVTDIASNAVVFAGVPVPVDAVIKSTGFGGKSVEVTLADGGRILDRRTVALQDGTREYGVGLTLVPEGEGVRSWSIAVSPLDGELTLRNNRRTFTARVRKSRLQIILVAGTPAPDGAAMRQALAEVDLFSVISFTQSPSGTFFEGPLRRSLLDSADCVIFSGFPSSTTSASTAQMLFDAVTQRKLPVFVHVSRSTDIAGLTRLAPWLPFTAGTPSPAEMQVSVEATPQERTAPVFTPGETGDGDPWPALPPVFAARAAFTPRADAAVHALMRNAGMRTPGPALLTRRAERHRVAVMLVHGVWRWRLMAQRSALTEQFFTAFMANAVRWLTAPDEAGPVIARPLKDSWSQGEPVRFHAEVYDARGAAIDDAEVRLVVERGDELREALMPPRGNGRYEGEVPGIPADGVYAYRVTASRAGGVLGSDSGRVYVSGSAIEFLNTRMDQGLLSALAMRTGGRALTPEELPRLDSLLTPEAGFAPRTTSAVTEVHVRMSVWYAGTIILLLALEWFLRKRSGMI